MMHQVILILSLLSFVVTPIFGMNGEGKNICCAPLNPYLDSEKTGQEKEDDFKKMLDELVPLFKFAVQIAKSELKFEQQQNGDAEKSDLESDPSVFKPLFDGEDIYHYSKLDSKLISSLLNNCSPLLRFQVELMKNGSVYKSLNERKQFSINRLLLYGPPGSGKSSLAKAIADYCNFPRQFVIASSLLNQYKNSGQVNIRRIFGPLLQTEEYVAIILDELTGLTDRHGKKDNPDEGTVEQLLGILDHCAVHKNLLFIATTNEIKKLPEQLKDRFCGSMFKIDKPDPERREQFIESLLEDDSSEDDEDVVNDIRTLEVQQDLQFFNNINVGEKIWLRNQTKNFSNRQLYAMASLVHVFALKRNCDEKYTIVETKIRICLQDYKDSIEFVRSISKESAKSSLKKYYKMFKEVYPFITQFLHICGGLYLQHRGTKMQLEFSNMWQEKQARAQKEFQEKSHQETMLLQERHNQESLEQSKVASDKQLKVQEDAAWWNFAFGGVSCFANVATAAVNIGVALYKK